MKLYFENAKELTLGIERVAPELDIELVEKENAQIVVTVKEVSERFLNVSLRNNTATVTYGDGYVRFFRALAILTDAVRNEKSELEVTERPIFKTNGAMVDMSRNAVMNIKTLKAMLRKMALMGLNSYQLYIEDTYEIEKYPYFGYMRGRYTKEELCELDGYAHSLGIELIPCIQVLGHLATHLRWSAASPYKDTANALLVNADETYALINNMMKTVSECFTTRRIHIGMDETHDLGTGKYLDRFGYRERKDIYFEHLERVADIIESYGFEPMMWSDMFFRLAGKNIEGYEDYHIDVSFDEDFVNSVPKRINQVFWDYYHSDESFYSINIDKHRRLFGDNILFAGGVWLWSGHCPLYSESLANSLPALEACRKKGVCDVFATVWLNGAECSLLLSLAGLAWYADYDYKGGFDIESVKHCFSYSCRASYDDLIKCELLEHPHGERFSVTRALLYNDPLIGLFDKHFENIDTDSYYKSVTAELNKVNKDCGIFSSAVEVIRRLSELLENKASFGIRLKAAYDNGDRTALAKIADECIEVIEKLNRLRFVHRTAWMEYNKPFGWEAHDIRYGGLLARFESARVRILDYLNKKIDRIEELEAVRLSFDGSSCEHEPINSGFFWFSYPSIATAGRLY